MKRSSGEAIDSLYGQLKALSADAKYGFGMYRTDWGKVNSESWNRLLVGFCKSIRELAKDCPVKYFAGAFYTFNGKIYEVVEPIVVEQAFQLQDDYLDVYGDTKVFGKEIGGDITSNKKTYMLINAFNHANDAQRAELQKWVDAEEFDRKEKVAAVTRLYNEIGIDKMAQDKIAYYFEQSKKYLDAVNVPAERKEELAKYAQKMMKRQY